MKKIYQTKKKYKKFLTLKKKKLKAEVHKKERKELFPFPISKQYSQLLALSKETSNTQEE